MNGKLTTYMTGWIIVLIIELLWFKNLTNKVHDQEEVLFILAVIVVTLVVGAVWLVLSVVTSKKQ